MATKSARRKRSSGLPNFWKNGLMLWEIASTAPQVIAHRTAGIVKAGFTPKAKDCREMIMMGQEKVEAFQEAIMTSAHQIVYLNQQLTAAAFGQITGLRIKSGEKSKATGIKLSKTMANIMNKSLKPVHRRVTANAKRLARS